MSIYDLIDAYLIVFSNAHQFITLETKENCRFVNFLGMIQKELFLVNTPFCERNSFRVSNQALTAIHKR